VFAAGHRGIGHLRFSEGDVDFGGDSWFHELSTSQMSMFLNHLGKFLFPRLQASQYGQKFRIIAATLLVGLIVAGSVAAAMVWRGAASR
jgi:hypothetical protein